MQRFCGADFRTLVAEDTLRSRRKAATYITEIQQIEQVALGKPQRDRYCLEQQKQQE